MRDRVVWASRGTKNMNGQSKREQAEAFVLGRLWPLTCPKDPSKSLTTLQ